MFCFACGDPAEGSTGRRKLLGDKDDSKRVFRAWKLICATKLGLSNDKMEEIAADTKFPGIVCRYSWDA